MIKEKSYFNARESAIKGIIQTLQSSEPLPVILNKIFVETKLALENSNNQTALEHFGQNKAFCTDLVYAYLRLGGILEQALAKLLAKPNSLPKDCKIALCLGLYELFLHNTEKNPQEHAIVFEYVECIKHRQNKKFSALVNGVLRNALRNQEDFNKLFQDILGKFNNIQQVSNKQLGKMSTFAKFSPLFKQEAEPKLLKALLASSINIPIASYRINQSKKQEFIENIDLQDNYQIYSNCLFQIKLLEKKADKQILSELEEQGLLTRQGLASQIFSQRISKLIKENPSELNSFWDTCTGRGGKSLALMELGHKISLCSDPNFERLNDFKKNMQRLHLTEQEPLIYNQSLQNMLDILPKIPNYTGSYDFILLDSPCSTSGTIARNPEVKFRISPQSLENTQKLQAELLAKAYTCLSPKGFLIYCTCSIFQKENEGQIQNFLENNSAKIIEQKYIIPNEINPDFQGHDILFYAILQKN